MDSLLLIGGISTTMIMRLMDFSVVLLLVAVVSTLTSSSHALLLKQPACLHRRSNAAMFTPRRGNSMNCLSRTTTTTTLSRKMVFDPNHMIDTILSSSTSFLLSQDTTDAAAESAVSYSKASYYTILGLYLISLPGLLSTIQRTTKAKIQLKTFVSPGAGAAAAAAENSSASNNNSSGGGGVGKSLRQEAAEIMAYMKANNYVVKDAGETITFEGIVQRSASQAFFLTFVAALGAISLALVLQIQFNDLVLPLIGQPNWYYLVLLSPYAGIYYWKSGDRVDQCSVKLQTNEAETENEIIVQGSEEELERMWRTLGWREKGMVKVEGLLKQYQ